MNFTPMVKGAVRLGQVTPPGWLPADMTWQYLCNYQDSWTGGGPVRQKTNSALPTTGVAVYFKNGSPNTNAPLYIGLATLAQANAYPTDPTQWLTYGVYDVANHPYNVVEWDGFTTEASITQTNLYIMTYSTSAGWFIGVTPSAGACVACDIYLSSWVTQSYGMTAGLMTPLTAQCADYTPQGETACRYAGCEWWCNQCQDAQPITCSYLTCDKEDCDYYNAELGCCWWNDACHDGAPSSCTFIDNPTDCTNPTCYNCHWYYDSCWETPGVTCWRCSGQTAVSAEFPPGSVCGPETNYMGYNYPRATQPNCLTNCTNPSRDEGDFACINYQEYQCSGGSWGATGETCLSDCEYQLNQTDCENNGCYWYSYPTPFGEKKCQTRPWVEAYMPHFIIGTGVAALAISLVSLFPRKSSTPYYPPPPQYYQQPPPQQKAYPQRKPRRKKK